MIGAQDLIYALSWHHTVFQARNGRYAYILPLMHVLVTIWCLSADPDR